jgi:hypothetical protein
MRGAFMSRRNEVGVKIDVFAVLTPYTLEYAASGQTVTARRIVPPENTNVIPGASMMDLPGG